LFSSTISSLFAKKTRTIPPK